MRHDPQREYWGRGWWKANSILGALKLLSGRLGGTTNIFGELVEWVD